VAAELTEWEWYRNGPRKVQIEPTELLTGDNNRWRETAIAINVTSLLTHCTALAPAVQAPVVDRTTLNSVVCTNFAPVYACDEHDEEVKNPKYIIQYDCCGPNENEQPPQYPRNEVQQQRRSILHKMKTGYGRSPTARCEEP